jgi:hypothetical protein
LPGHDLFCFEPICNKRDRRFGRVKDAATPSVSANPVFATACGIVIARHAVLIALDDWLALREPSVFARQRLRSLVVAQSPWHRPNVGVAARSPLADAIHTAGTADAAEAADPGGID